MSSDAERPKEEPNAELPKEEPGAEVPTEEPTAQVPTVHTGKPEQQPQSLEDLLRVAGPIATAYFQSAERMQAQTIEFDTKVLHEEGRRHRSFLVAATLVAMTVLILAGILMYRGRDDSAVDLIQLIVAVSMAAFGGYGVAAGRRGKGKKEK